MYKTKVITCAPSITSRDGSMIHDQMNTNRNSSNHLMYKPPLFWLENESNEHKQETITILIFVTMLIILVSNNYFKYYLNMKDSYTMASVVYTDL